MSLGDSSCCARGREHSIGYVAFVGLSSLAGVAGGLEAGAGGWLNTAAGSRRRCDANNVSSMTQMRLQLSRYKRTSSLCCEISQLRTLSHNAMRQAKQQAWVHARVAGRKKQTIRPNDRCVSSHFLQQKLRPKKKNLIALFQHLKYMVTLHKPMTHKPSLLHSFRADRQGADYIKQMNAECIPFF